MKRIVLVFVSLLIMAAVCANAAEERKWLIPPVKIGPYAQDATALGHKRLGQYKNMVESIRQKISSNDLVFVLVGEEQRTEKIASLLILDFKLRKEQIGIKTLKSDFVTVYVDRWLKSTEASSNLTQKSADTPSAKWRAPDWAVVIILIMATAILISLVPRLFIRLRRKSPETKLAEIVSVKEEPVSPLSTTATTPEPVTRPTSTSAREPASSPAKIEKFEYIDIPVGDVIYVVGIRIIVDQDGNPVKYISPFRHLGEKHDFMERSSYKDIVDSIKSCIKRETYQAQFKNLKDRGIISLKEDKSS